MCLTGETCGQKPLGDEEMKAYDREMGLWNEVYSEYQPIDLRNIHLTVEPGFDCCRMNLGKRHTGYLILDVAQEILFFSISSISRRKGEWELTRQKRGLRLQKKRRD